LRIEKFAQLQIIDFERQQNDVEIEKRLIENRKLAEQERALKVQLQCLIIEGKTPSVPLVFDDCYRTVFWNGGFLKLGKKPFQVLKLLYFATSRRMTITDLEAAVWKEITHGTIKSTVSRLGKRLTDVKCPYYIEPVMCQRQEWDIGNSGCPHTVAIRSSVAEYRLIERFFNFFNGSQISEC